MGSVYNFRCKFCGKYAPFGDFCSKECKQRYYIKYGIKDSKQKGIEGFF